MPAPSPLPPIQVLQEALQICAESPSGLRWKSRPKEHFNTLQGWKMFNTRDAGTPAGYRALSGCGHPHYGVKINQVKFPAHRIVYALHTGVDPWPREVDHIDRDPTNNHPSNLRVATRSQNASNKGRQSNNKSGHRGVTFCKRTGKWMAQIGLNSKTIFLGRFQNIEEAVQVRAAAELRLHKDFSPSFK